MISRRGFLTVTAASLCGAGCKGGSSGSREEVLPAMPLKLGQADEFQAGITDLPLYRVRVYCRSVGAQRSLSALSMVCTHQTCIVTREPDASFTCPCHGSRFDAAGKLLAGPAARALPWYGLTLDERRGLWVHFDRLVDSSWSLSV